MKPAVTIKTPTGLEYYNAIQIEYFKYKTTDKLKEFKIKVFTAREEIEKDILTFLEEPDMIRKYKMDEEDQVGWEFYTEMMDKYSTLNHFYNRKM